MLTAFAAVLGIHVAAYVLVLRRLALFRTEKGIFLYHFVSAVLVCSGAVVAGFVDPEGFGLAGFVVVLSVHGIYSLSFLEAWSLAQGGYSLSIMAGVARAEATDGQPDFSALVAIGKSKQDERVAALQALRLVQVSSGRLSLASRGVIVAALLHAMRAWVEPARPGPGSRA